MSGKKTKLKAGCGVVTLFGLGYVLGVVSLFILIAVIVPLAEGWKSDKSKKFIADHIAKQLELTDEQTEQLRPVVNEFLDRRWQLRRDYLKESERVMVEEYQPRLDEFLTAPQQTKLEGLLRGWKKDNQNKIEEPAER